ncbi:MAG: glycoside-pentoside-hexuronide (GPH):cation symporter [Bacteroides sp.]|jgi:GPH family glycoside/pentoside/hexuronide:cation symporter|nr:glycoside-pentoside-hexuronide (GPH):cation symporter [Bacteroides sp.]MCI1681716.1 glycoside-pentoside-hexuronide (GPH):cation symporter [Bacteroides sp.]
MKILKERIGYGFGDMSSSMFWKIFSYYLPIFYSNIYGLGLADTGILLLVTRIWDAVSDPMMGIIADRTYTRWGKYRPYLLWMAFPFAICGMLLFTTPDFGRIGKLVWAYTTYIMMMTVYTAINVPYGAMLGVMTDDSDEKTVFSSYRMFFAFGGSFVALFAWEPLCIFFYYILGSVEKSWQYSMMVIAILCLIIFLFCFGMTCEHIKNFSTVSPASDFKSLIHNKPWWIVICAALCSNLFSTLRGAAAVYFFTGYIGNDTFLKIGNFSVLFYAGLFLSVGEVSNMLGVILTVPLSNVFGKKSTYIFIMGGVAMLSILFFYLPCNQIGFWLMLILQIIISICTGIISPLVWSMYADVSDYAELKNNTASTGLIFSSSSMAQKFGGAFGGAAVMWILSLFGYNTIKGAMQTDKALIGLNMLMSWIPAFVAILAMIIMRFYPLTRVQVVEVSKELKKRRVKIAE